MADRTHNRTQRPAVLRLFWSLVFVCLSVYCGSTLSAADPDAADFFHRQVEPLLKRHCYECHSHAAGSMQSGLALDWKSGWVAGGERGPALVPGKPELSLLIQAVRHAHDELKMPAKQLSPREIEILTEWVRQGAFDDRIVAPQARGDQLWWSLKPLSTPAVPPPATHDKTADNPIDSFILARLADAELSPSPPAAARDLIRRLYFDLVGLPPPRQIVEQFESDPCDANYMRIVDALLASPQYGQRWARHWFDTIHFADSHGYEHDVGRDHAWPYRDYVIEALNSDRPWSTFIRQQLAVDIFEPESSHLMPALGFLGAGTFDYSTYQTGPVTFDYLDRDDMLTQTMSAFLSTTANCARCHAHKFDPITQEDYYALQAVFAGIVKGDVAYDADPKVAAERQRWTRLLDAVKRSDTVALQADDVRALAARWEQERGSDGVTWQTLGLSSFISTGGATLTKAADDVIVAGGKAPEVDTYIVTGTSTLARITAIRLDLLPHASLPMQGPGRCHNGNLHLTQVSATLFTAGGSAGKQITLHRASADFNQEGWEVHRSIDDDPKTAWGIYPAVGQAHYAVFELSEPVELPAGATLTFSFQQLHGGSHLIGAFRLAVTDQPGEQARAVPKQVSAALSTARGERTAEQTLSIIKHAAQSTAEQHLARLPAQSMVYAAAPRVAIPLGNGKSQPAHISAPKLVHLMKRGDINQPQDVVSPGALTALQHLPSRFNISPSVSEATRRAALADWIAHPENVLTWRSIVNRVWHYHFGRGLCDTPSDLGRMGGVPSHPELIDWLAVWFRDQAHGSLKQLHRLIVTSRTYRQSSMDRPEAVSIDAENRMLWRQNRLRLDADAYRDYVLSASGRIDWRMGGPAVQHFHQSPGAQLTPKLDYAAYDWAAQPAGRRSIYRYVWRGIPDPLLSALDFPDLGLLTPTRSQSISPLQALALYNNNFVLFHSRSMAEEIQSLVRDVDVQIAEVALRCYQRQLSSEELREFRRHADKHGLSSLCRLLFNSSEFMFVP